MTTHEEKLLNKKEKDRILNNEKLSINKNDFLDGTQIFCLIKIHFITCESFFKIFSTFSESFVRRSCSLPDKAAITNSNAR